MRFRRNSLVFHRGWQALRFLLKPSGEEFVLSSEFFAPLNDRRLVHLPSRLFQSLFSLGKGDLQPVINENIFGPGSVNGSTERFIDPTLLSLPIEFTQPPHEVGKFPLFVRTFFFWLLHEPSLFTQAGGGALRTSVGGRLGDPERSLRLPKDLFGRATEPRPFGFRIGRIREDNPIPKLRETTPPIFDFNRFRAFVTGGLFNHMQLLTTKRNHDRGVEDLMVSSLKVKELSGNDAVTKISKEIVYAPVPNPPR